MKKINGKIVPMNVASLTLDFVMDTENAITCIVKHPSGAILDVISLFVLNQDIVFLSDSICEIVNLAINEMSNLDMNNHE